MRQHTLHHYCHLLFCLLVNSARLAFVQADGNVFLRGVSTAQAQTVLQKEANNCPGVRSLMGDFPVITGATTSISTEQSQQQTSGEFNDGSFSFSQQVLYKCSEDPQVLETPGVWYSLSGRDAFVHAALLFESVTNQKMAIFEASDCQPSQCLMVSNSFSKQLDWFAKSDKTYFIKVFATTPALSGTFILQLEEFTSPRPSNDMCQTAQLLRRGTITRDASFEAWPHGLDNSRCSLEQHSRGLFYRIEGTGHVITVSLQPNISEGKLGLIILAGDDCGICVGHSRFVTAIDSKQVISLPTQLGEVYHILVSGEDIGDAGSFKLTVD